MSHQDTFDIRGQEAAQEEAVERVRLLEKQNVNDLKWLMSDKRGRRFVARLLDMAGMHRSSFDTNNAQMALKEGIRWVGLRVAAEIETHCFDRYIEMLKEQKQ